MAWLSSIVLWGSLFFSVSGIAPADPALASMVKLGGCLLFRPCLVLNIDSIVLPYAFKTVLLIRVLVVAPQRLPRTAILMLAITQGAEVKLVPVEVLGLFLDTRHRRRLRLFL